MQVAATAKAAGLQVSRVVEQVLQQHPDTEQARRAYNAVQRYLRAVDEYQWCLELCQRELDTGVTGVDRGELHTCNAGTT